ncbi:hypothetical protein H072_6114 [Dactylellina haptotyla CBS 200.50]|uniref:Mitochondrial import inner membrane translocase subunit n=1 Tax=Dactylellina haptotyla (strain CBS 200.50) TaxID=1284197 RepID=S8AAX9_DACHA|nr:hypothetical protein H072_6114 [Dactylellina haptotyla CBS 200.50]
MSMFGFGGAQGPSSAQKIAAAEAELEMVTDMFNRLTNSCFKKCVPKDYRETDLNKGESVCLDRCVAKFFEVNVKVSEQMQNQAASRQGGAPGAGGMFGM